MCHLLFHTFCNNAELAHTRRLGTVGTIDGLVVGGHTAGYAKQLCSPRCTWWNSARRGRTVLKRLDPAPLSELTTLTHSDNLQPVLLGQLNDKWCCQSANICFPLAVSSGNARTDSCRPTGLAAAFTANQPPFGHMREEPWNRGK